MRKVLLLLLIISSSIYGNANCGITYSGETCINNTLTFSVNNTSYTSITWDFSGEGFSYQNNAAFNFAILGKKTIRVKLDFQNASSCIDSLEIEIFPLPEIKYRLVSKDTQCIFGNSFCFVDSSAFVGCVSLIKYLFDDGELLTFENPTNVLEFCKTFYNDEEMISHYSVEVYSCNNCVSKYNSEVPLVIRSSGSVSFTSNFPIGCDTLTAFFQNTSTLNIEEVIKFKWDFGDGNFDSTTWGKEGLNHFYQTRGKNQDYHDVKLTVWHKWGCVKTYEIEKAVYLTKMPLVYNPISDYCMNGGNFNFGLLDSFPLKTTFEYKMTGFGSQQEFFFTKNKLDDPIKPESINKILGANLFYLKISHTLCGDYIIRDTFLVRGPYVVEMDNNHRECKSRDPKQFINNIVYFGNDNKIENDDSAIIVNGLPVWQFDSQFNPLKSQQTQRKDDFIFRLWNFGDDYAPQCTTNTALGINVDRNCNFSVDRNPQHFYVPWDSIYQMKYFIPNVVHPKLTFSDSGDCEISYIDTSDRVLHEKLSYKLYDGKYAASIIEMDTISLCSINKGFQIYYRQPDISPATIRQVCNSEENGLKVQFDFNESRPNQYNNVEVNKYYPSGVWEQYQFDDLQSSFDIQYPPNQEYKKGDTVFIAVLVKIDGCTDTFKGHFVVESDRLPSASPIIHKKRFCFGEVIPFGLNYKGKDNPNNMEEINWNISKIDKGSGDFCIEKSVFRINEKRINLAPHPNPDSSHLKVDYLVISNSLSEKVDTILLNESYAFDTIYSHNSNSIDFLKDLWNQLGLYERDFNLETIHKLFWNGEGIMGDSSTGAIGCLDTSGLLLLMTQVIEKKPNSYRTLNPRDTSIYPIDTTNVNGVKYPNTYSFKPKTKGKHKITLSGSNFDNSCDFEFSEEFLVGFHSEIEISDTVFCGDNEFFIKPIYRYFDEESSCTEIDETDFWKLNLSNAGKAGFEGITKVDWNINDDDTTKPETIFGNMPYGTVGYQDSFMAGGIGANKKYYTESGLYTMRIATKDKYGCEDTLFQNIYYLKANVKFNLDIDELNCRTIVQFVDSSFMTDLDTPFHKFYRWNIDWGNGKQSNFIDNKPSNLGYYYSGYGTYNVKFKAQTKGILTEREPMCVDSAEMELYIPGPVPKFEPITPLIICLGDSVSFANTSIEPSKAGQFIWNMGDSTYLTSGHKDTITYTYRKPGIYSVFLILSDSLPGTVHYCSSVYPDTSFMKEIKVIVLGFEDAEFLQDKVEICPGDTVKFNLKGFPNSEYYTWKITPNGEEFVTSDSLFTHVFNNPGIFEIISTPKLDTLFGSIECSNTEKGTVYVDSIKADFDFNIEDFPQICFKSNSINSEKLHWGFRYDYEILDTLFFDIIIMSEYNDLESFCYKHYNDTLIDTVFCLKVTSPGGCEDIVCKRLEFENKRWLFIPNVFTPGKDGFNDFFNIDIGGHEFYDLVVYNRWGEIVFESKDHEYNWNGNLFNGNIECSDGVYYYLFKYKLRQEEAVNVNGIIHLIREK